jgi:nucleotide-binding universal stress UspA family protein
MMKNILIPLDPTPFTENAIAYGCELGHQHGAVVTGMGILDTPGIIDSVAQVQAYDPGFASAEMINLERDGKTILQGMLDHFDQVCSAKSVFHRQVEVEGMPHEAIVQYSAFYDLLILGARNHFNFETSAVFGDTLSKVLDHSITPLMVVPQESDPSKHNNILVAYDASLPSKRALKSYAKLWKHDEKELRLVMSHPDKEYAHHQLDEAHDFLKTHDVNLVHNVWTESPIEKYLTGDHYDWADMIVLGAHTRHGVAEFLFGSLTRELLKRADKPLFIGL